MEKSFIILAQISLTSTQKLSSSRSALTTDLSWTGIMMLKVLGFSSKMATLHKLQRHALTRMTGTSLLLTDRGLLASQLSCSASHTMTSERLGRSGPSLIPLIALSQ